MHFAISGRCDEREGGALKKLTLELVKTPSGVGGAIRDLESCMQRGLAIEVIDFDGEKWRGEEFLRDASILMGSRFPV